MTDEKLRDARIVKKLPDIFGRRQPIPKDLVGATILRFGTYQDGSLVEGGGLVIDFQPAGADETHRLVLAFNDTAMWVAAEFPVERMNAQAASFPSSLGDTTG
jgi:hypothetical protein